MTAEGEHLEQAILRLLRQRGEGKTACPSEVARTVDPANWRPLMQPVREAADRLAAHGLIVATQKGKVVDLKDVRGPVRLRLA